MFGIGMPELLLIFVIALLVFGPAELPKIGRTIGRAMAELRRASDDLKEGIQREIDAAEREMTEPPPEPERPAETTVAAASPEVPLSPAAASDGTAAPAVDPSATTEQPTESAAPTPSAEAPSSPEPVVPPVEGDRTRLAQPASRTETPEAGAPPTPPPAPEPRAENQHV